MFLCSGERSIKKKHYNIGRRRSWRAGVVCKIIAIVLSGFESHPPDQYGRVIAAARNSVLKTGGTRDCVGIDTSLCRH